MYFIGITAMSVRKPTFREIRFESDYTEPSEMDGGT
jgi:hypothetical protein